jgi:hypothetical protein
MISSKTVDSSVVDREFMDQLKEALQRGVRVTIDLSDDAPLQQSAIALERLRSSFPALEVRFGYKAKFYHLICDEAFALVSNRPFLSIVGTVRSFHHVVGYLLQRDDLVRAFATRLQVPNAKPTPAVRPRLAGKK